MAEENRCDGSFVLPLFIVGGKIYVILSHNVKYDIYDILGGRRYDNETIERCALRELCEKSLGLFVTDDCDYLSFGLKYNYKLNVDDIVSCDFIDYYYNDNLKGSYIRCYYYRIYNDIEKLNFKEIQDRYKQMISKTNKDYMLKIDHLKYFELGTLPCNVTHRAYIVCENLDNYIRRIKK